MCFINTGILLKERNFLFLLISKTWKQELKDLGDDAAEWHGYHGWCTSAPSLILTHWTEQLVLLAIIPFVMK